MERSTADGGGAVGAAHAYPMSFAIFALARAHRALAGALLADLGLHPGQELILMHLWEHDGRSQKSLVEVLRLDHSTVAKSVRRLELAGLVTRTRSHEDGRVTVVALTDTGRALEQRIHAAWSALERATATGLSDAERTHFVAIAGKIAPNLQ